MKVKKLTALAVSLLLAVSTTACSGGDGDVAINDDAAKSPDTAETEEITEPADPIELTCWVNEAHTDIFEYRCDA